MKKMFFLLLLLVLAIAFAIPRLDSYQREGSLTLPSLEAGVRVLQDESGVP